MLRDHRAHEQAAVTPAQYRQLLRTRPFLLDQVFGRRGEIIEHVLLPGQIASLMPFLTEFAAAANVGHDVNAPVIEPNSAGEIEIGRHADAITAVAVE